MADGRPLGVLVVADKENRSGGVDDFTIGDERILSLFGNQAAIALENARLHREAVEKERMEREVELAASIQKTILPVSLPDVPGLRLAGGNRPTRQVGGDYYDVFPLPDGRTAFCVADVAGKGVPAALLVSTVHACLRILLDTGVADLPGFVSRVHRHLLGFSSTRKFVTLFFAVYDPLRHEVRYVNAGHNPGVRLAGREVTLLPSGGPPIGILPDAVFRESVVSLVPGDTLVLYSDGITEAVNGADEEFGMDRLVALVRGSDGDLARHRLERNLRSRLGVHARRRPIRRPDGPRRMRVLRGTRSRSAAAALLLLAACTFSRETAIYRHELLPPAAPDSISALNVEEKLGRGMIPEVIAYLAGPGGRNMVPETAARLLAEAKLESGDFPSAELLAGRVIARTQRMSVRAEMEWLRSQSAYWRGDFGDAARWAEAARVVGSGYPGGVGHVPPLGRGAEDLRWGHGRRAARPPVPARKAEPHPAPGPGERPGRERHDPRLRGLPVSPDGVRGTASRRRAVEGAVAPARGLHDKQIPMRFGWARSLTIGALTIQDVPFGILPDGTLSFETESLGLFTPEGVLGVHFMKEFDWRIEPSERRLQAIRLPSGRRGAAGPTRTSSSSG